jgi:hypothetical protein
MLFSNIGTDYSTIRQLFVQPIKIGVWKCKREDILWEYTALFLDTGQETVELPKRKRVTVSKNQLFMNNKNNQ